MGFGAGTGPEVFRRVSYRRAKRERCRVISPYAYRLDVSRHGAEAPSREIPEAARRAAAGEHCAGEDISAKRGPLRHSAGTRHCDIEYGDRQEGESHTPRSGVHCAFRMRNAVYLILAKPGYSCHSAPAAEWPLPEYPFYTQGCFWLAHAPSV